MGPAEAHKSLAYLTGALKAPRIKEDAVRSAATARDQHWSYEEYLAAVLEREVAARNASGARLRVKAAGFPAIKTAEDFDFTAQTAFTHTDYAAMASGRYLAEAGNIVLLGPPAPERPTWPPPWASPPATRDTGCSTPPLWTVSTGSRPPIRPDG